MIKIRNNENQVETYNSLNDLAKRLKPTQYGYNAPTCRTIIEKAGYDLATLEDDGKHSKSPNSKVNKDKSIIEYVINKATTIDKDAIKNIQQQVTTLLNKNPLTADDVDTINELRNKIASLETPSVNDKDVVKYFAEMLKTYRESQTEVTE